MSDDENAYGSHKRSKKDPVTTTSSNKDRDGHVYTWETSSTGFGRKILSKFGYKEGKAIGKSEEGILSPIRASNRVNQDKTGIDFNPIKIKAKRENRDLNSKGKWKKEGENQPNYEFVHKPTHLDYSSSEDSEIEERSSDDEDDQDSDDLSASQAEREEEWRSILSRSEEEVEQIYQFREQIINMIYKEEHRMKHSNATAQLPHDVPKEELNYYRERWKNDLPLMSAHDEASRLQEISDIIRRASNELQRWQTLVNRFETGGEKQDSLNASSDIKENILDEDERADDERYVLRLVKMVKEFDQFLQKEYSVEYEQLELFHLAIIWLNPVLIFCIDNIWTFNEDLDDQNLFSHYVELYIEWKEFLSPKVTFRTHHLWSEIPQCIISKIRHYLIYDWSNVTSTFCLHLIRSWRDQIPLEPILDTFVPPKLLNAVKDDWDPKEHHIIVIDQDEDHRRSTPNINSWLLPWIKILGIGQLESCISVVYSKLREMLLHYDWRLSDYSIIMQLEPWSNDRYMYSFLMEKLVIEAILPKFKDLLLHFEINPRHQDLESFWILSEWTFFIMSIQSKKLSNVIAKLFEIYFFRRWLNVLFIWLDYEDDDLHHRGRLMEEVSRWYSGWKDLFANEKSAFRDLYYTRFFKFFHSALCIISAVLQIK